MFLGGLTHSTALCGGSLSLQIFSHQQQSRAPAVVDSANKFGTYNISQSADEFVIA